MISYTSLMITKQKATLINNVNTKGIGRLSSFWACPAFGTVTLIRVLYRLLYKCSWPDSSKITESHSSKDSDSNKARKYIIL